MIIVKYNGTQKNYHDADFLYILYYTHRYTTVQSAHPYRNIMSNKYWIYFTNVFHIYMCICHLNLYSKNYQLYHVIQYRHFHLGEKN